VSAAARRRAPLTGADCFLRAFDDEIRRTAGASHVSQLVLRLGPGFDAEGLRAVVAEVAQRQPIVRAPIRRPLGVAPPVYDLARARRRPPPPVEVHEGEADGADGGIPPLFFRRLNERMAGRRGELLRFDAVRGRGGAHTDLAVSWLHPLLDGDGSERFVEWLDACHRGETDPGRLPSLDELAAGAPPEAPLAERGRAARAWQHWLAELHRPPPRSLAGPLRPVPQELRYEVLTFPPDESARIAESARGRAGFLTPMLFYLAAALRAHRDVFRARGEDPESLLVPLPVNLRPRGREGAVFRTHVSLLWFRALREEMDDFEELLASLKAQRRDAIREGQVENGVHAMHFARLAPRRLYAHMARRGGRGELCAFFFAYTGAFCAGAKRFFGAEIENGFHVAPVPPSPGSCVALSTREGRLNVTHVFQRGVLEPGERELFRARLRADLLA